LEFSCYLHPGKFPASSGIRQAQSIRILRGPSLDSIGLSPAVSTRITGHKAATNAIPSEEFSLRRRVLDPTADHRNARQCFMRWWGGMIDIDKSPTPPKRTNYPSKQRPYSMIQSIRRKCTPIAASHVAVVFLACSVPCT
jgi:hypothetical protein